MRRARPLLFACLALAAVPASALAHDGEAPAPALPHGDTPAEVRIDVAAAVRAEARTQAASVTVLPTEWCGAAPTAADDTVNAVHPLTTPQFKLVYAYPTDVGNRFALWRDNLQANVSVISQFLAAQSGGLKAPRFDMGTSCGPQYADIAVVALPGPRSAYVDDLDDVEADVLAALGPAPGLRNTVILGDALSSGGLWGVGTLWIDDDPGAPNWHNHVANTSVIWARNLTPPAASANGFWPEGFLHEMTHNMGGVQWTAPHNTAPNQSGYFHCWDGNDVMCYADGPLAHAQTSTCSLLTSAINKVYDCGGDDYFNPAPGAGNYLATHWNVFDSVFLADCATLGNACGHEDGAPSASAAPSVSGTGRVGATLTGTTGSWSGSPSLALQWQRNAGSGWQDVAGATGATHVPADADAGSFVRLAVTATNGSGSATATSNAVLVTQRTPPVNLSAPVVSGTPQVGRTLGAWWGSWSGATSLTIAWEREGATAGTWSPIDGAVQTSYVPTAADGGRRLRVRVRAVNTDGAVLAWSAPVGPTAADPTPAAEPPAPEVESAPPGSILPLTAMTTTMARALVLRSGRRTVARLRITATLTAGAGRATLRSRRIAVPSGAYRLRVCGTACRVVTVRARRGSLKVPAVAVAVRAGTTVRVTLKAPRLRAAGASRV